MTASTLALFIASAILVQLVAFAVLGWRRRQRQFLAMARTTPAASLPGEAAPPASVSARPAWDGLREFVVRRREIEDADRSVCSFYLEPADVGPLPGFRPGQYLTFQLAIPDPATGEPRSVTRCYSLSDPPGRDYYRVSIKRVPAPAGRPDLPPGVSSSYFHDQVRVGTRLMVKAPAGHFHLQGDATLPLVLIGGGIGVTPMLSMLGAVLENGPARELWLFYGVRNGAEHLMKDRLQALAARYPNFHLHVCYSQPGAADREGVDYQHHGRVDVALLRNTLNLARYQFYVCGPRAMMETLVPALEDWGVDPADIHYEAFGPATLKRPSKAPAEADAAAIDIRFSASGKTVRWDQRAESLLAFAEDHGIAVESGCRAGSCGGCQTRIEQGEVSYFKDPDADIAAGHCLLCVSVPKGDLTLAA